MKQGKKKSKEIPDQVMVASMALTKAGGGPTKNNTPVSKAYS